MEKGIKFENVSFRYDTLDAKESAYALKNISFTLKAGEYVGILGKTGCGKSTLMQLCNGLLKPSQGIITFDGNNIHEKGYSLRNHRMKVAYCFQYPEYQLFEETVIKDICFGLKNQGLTEEESIQKARQAMRWMELDESIEEQSPFMLSGGQRRKVAIAGILAMEPEVLLLDEPVAGLDYEAKKNLFGILRQINKDRNTTIVLVSHDLNDIAEQAGRVLILSDGQLLGDGKTKECFYNQELLEKAGLIAPDTVTFYQKLLAAGWKSQRKDSGPLTLDELARSIAGEQS